MRIAKLHVASDKESGKQGGNMEEYLIVVRWGTLGDREGWNVEYLKKSPGGKYEFVYGSESPYFPVKVDQVGPIQEDLLLNALRAEFPQSQIKIELE